MTQLSLLGVPTSAGSYAAGQDQAPRALRAAGLVPALTAAGLVVEDAGDTDEDPGEREDELGLRRGGDRDDLERLRERALALRDAHVERAARHLVGEVVSVLEHTGNTSAASIPYALAEAADQGRVADGALVLLVGFGAGMTGASALLRWGR